MFLSCTVNEILSIVSQNVKRSRDTSHIPFGGGGVIYDACTTVLVFLCIDQHTKFKMPSFTGFKDMIGVKLKNGSRDPEHAHYRSGLSSKPKHLIYSTGLTAIQNLATVASAVLDI